ncbi:Flagellar L-ring protein [Rhodovastum atsumiense]|uniref:Flagellar L-ring protein n=1 Tax=Rhodovastum atsumiense TaxID=504468 RepID=A0A5M6ISG2_9PROT|nr:flagellar basal body L-ring protein FlgH [Rhodovastum atsumiense]KAA5611131.1 flagellar basal body L-ring protein FlgH [Rhodovastum atsumiense]CAH2599198.1 Flagellar L-ring protein [Rhodovastum atsumiense]
MTPRPAALLAVLLLPLLGGCGALQRLSEVGRPPQMTPSSDPTRDPAWRPMSLPMPSAQIADPQANALWRPGSRAFFKDQRAAQVGDIVTVLINITDSANLQNNTDANRNGSESMGVPNLFGFEQQIPKILAGANPSSLVSTNSANSNVGKATIKRNEAVVVRLAGVITQVLPNGNLAVAARQEVRVNRELRELAVTGVIRPQDIGSDNTVQHDRMAEARIAYGGRGQLTDPQSPRWGQQVLDIILPF